MNTHRSSLFPFPGGDPADFQGDAMKQTEHCAMQTYFFPEEQASAVLQRLDQALLLVGCPNLFCHTEHLAEPAEHGIRLRLLTQKLPTLREYLGSRNNALDEILCLPSDPVQAKLQLRAYLNRTRVPDKEIRKLGIDLCRAIETCGKVGLDHCAVTEDTVRVSLGGDFLLGDLGLAVSEDVCGIRGVGLLMHRLLGAAEETSPLRFGDPQLQQLVLYACAEAITADEMRQELEALDRAAAARIRKAAAYRADQERQRQLKLRLLHLLHRRADALREKANRENRHIYETIPPVSDRDGDFSDIIEKNAGIAGSISTGRSHTVFLTRTGTAVALGDESAPQCQVVKWRDLKAVAAGAEHSVGLKSNGQVVAAGNNAMGQCNVSGWSFISHICAGANHTVGCRYDGSVVAVGASADAICNVGHWTQIVATAAGTRHTVGLRRDGTVVSTGSNLYGQCNVSSWRQIVAIAASDRHTVGLTIHGTVLVAGEPVPELEVVSTWTDVTAIAAGDGHIVGLLYDGTVLSAGIHYTNHRDIAAWSEIVAISAGGTDTVALRADGTVVAAGGQMPPSNKQPSSFWEEGKTLGFGNPGAFHCGETTF